MFVNKLILERNNLLYPQPNHVEWYYGEIEPMDQLENVKYTKGLPLSETVRPNSIIVLDDLMVEARNDATITNLFTRVSHHQQCLIVYITQNMYHQSSQNRTRNLNVHYLVLFKNIRDKTLINTLARQMYPGMHQFLISVYEDALSAPYKCLFLDFRPETDETLRIRQGIFEDEAKYVYINNK